MDQSPLNYANPSRAEDREARWRSAARRTRFHITVAATAVAASICLRIEWLNHRAGGFLPRADDGKWRVGIGPAARANADLRDVVSTWGCLQYPLVALTLLVASTVAFDPRCHRHHRIVAAGCILALLSAGACAVYRGYFTSLGE